jgi:hypothetical protein
MIKYDDEVISLDETGITVRNFYRPGRPRHIRYDDVVQAELISLGFGTGRHQLVGVGPLRPLLFFHWDRKRAAKTHGLSLDLGNWLRFAITPDDPDRALDLIRSGIERG